MKKLIKSRVFIGAFLTAYFLLSFLFSIMTVSVASWKKSGITLGVIEYGFPFVYYTTHCFGAENSLLGLIGNLLTAAILSFVFGLVAAWFWLRFSAPEFRAKWHT